MGEAVNPTRGQPDRAAAPVPAVQLRFLRVPEPGRPGLARLELANRQERPIAGQVRLAAEPAGAARIEGSTTLEYRLEPGATSASELTVAVAGDAARGGQLVVERLADGRRIPFALPVRQRLQLSRLAVSSAAALPAALAALPPRTLHTAAGRGLAELRLARCGDRLAVLCHAFDPEPVRTRGLWDGSCLELFAAVPGGPVRQLLLAPPAAGAAEPAAVLVRPAENHREPVLVAAAGLELAADAVPGGWRLAALVPLAWWLGVDPAPQDFLLDVIVGGGGRAALSGDLAASQRSDAYATVC
ncbi:MAG: hypothetical protein L6R48_05750 [Planctomycetes bacterium]|nr:hypothetical protein [Planctomycetota bacterium]